MSITEISIANPVLRKTPWKPGPVVNPTDTVLVSLTDFHIDGYRDLVRVMRTALRIQRGWDRRDGSLGLALWVQPLRKRLGSLSAWESEQHYRRWVSSSEHMHVVRRHRGHMQNLSSATWETETFDVEDAWQEVGRRWAAAAT